MSNPNVTIDRDKFIGGSDLPSILGYNIKYGITPFEFAKQKAGIIKNQFKGNQFTKYGQVMEPVIRDYINTISNTNYKENTIIDETRNYRGNTDGLDEDAPNPLIEIKTYGNNLNIDYYTPQCQFYMELFHKNSCTLIGYKRPDDFYTGVDYDLENDESYFNFNFDKSKISVYTIKRDPEMWENINERIIAFKTAVQALKDNTNMTENEFNNILYGTEIVEISNKISLLNQTLENYKKINQEYEELKNKLYNIFDEKGLISVSFPSINIKKVAPTSYETTKIDTTQLEADEPFIYNKYKKTKTINKKGYILISQNKGDKNNAN